MYAYLVFAAVCLLGVSAQEPQRCVSPPVWTAKLFEIDSRRTFDVFANITYDATNQRIRIDESIDNFTNPTRDYFDTFFFFKEKMMYIVNLTSKECKKRDLPDDIVFHPVGIPPDARPLGEAVIGSNAGIKIGVTVDLWSGTSPRGGRYMGVWTSVGCIPVSELHRLESGDILRQSFYDVALGDVPERFIPPSNCQ
ncbi:ependymin-like [Halichondria panicea]|uniref:ependymin-like n=1 Tax=Halichondria panicea TaxID=6063 RepID=UPI00312B6F70